jgi:enoyl-CoA hydratase/carnithine racemase
MFALGEPMEPAAALACGLANAVVPQGELRKKARDASARTVQVARRLAYSRWQNNRATGHVTEFPALS